MGTQNAIAGKIIDGGGDCLLVLKEDQGTLHDEAIDYVNDQTKTDFRGSEPVGWTPWKRITAGSRSEPIIQMPAPKSLPGFDNWKGLLSIGIARVPRAACGPCFLRGGSRP